MCGYYKTWEAEPLDIRAGTEIVHEMKRNQFQVLATMTNAEGGRNERKHLTIHICHLTQYKHSTGNERGKISSIW